MDTPERPQILDELEAALSAVTNGRHRAAIAAAFIREAGTSPDITAMAREMAFNVPTTPTPNEVRRAGTAVVAIMPSYTCADEKLREVHEYLVALGVVNAPLKFKKDHSDAFKTGEGVGAVFCVTDGNRKKAMANLALEAGHPWERIVVYLCGHGTPDGSLCMTGARPLSQRDVAEAMSAFAGGDVVCALNLCFAEPGLGSDAWRQDAPFSWTVIASSSAADGPQSTAHGDHFAGMMRELRPWRGVTQRAVDDAWFATQDTREPLSERRPPPTVIQSRDM